MKKKELLKLLDNVQEHREETVLEVNDRVLLIDGLNLFFRNFAMLNAVNPDGVHVGGLGGFFRSLGALIRQIQPTSVYVVFDGAGSTTNRKNLLPEYKSGRNLQRITNWEVFESLDDEDDAKIDQIVRAKENIKLTPADIGAAARETPNAVNLAIAASPTFTANFDLNTLINFGFS